MARRYGVQVKFWVERRHMEGLGRIRERLGCRSDSEAFRRVVEAMDREEVLAEVRAMGERMEQFVTWMEQEIK